jgi:hypothetical protein
MRASTMELKKRERERERERGKKNHIFMLFKALLQW